MSNTTSNRSKLEAIKQGFGKAGPVIALIILCIFLSIANPNFLTVTNILSVAGQASYSGF